MRSLWQSTAKLPRFPSLHGDIHTDVLIIGGGMAGLLTAYFLRQRGVDCVLVEKDRICGGTTGFTTAKITAQHGLIYHKLLQKFGIEAAKGYLAVQQDAVEEYARLCEHIDCDFARKDNYVYSTDNAAKLMDELNALQQIGATASFIHELPLPFAVSGAVRFSGQAQFHPLKFAAAIAEGLPIYENTFVREMVGNTAITDQGKISAEQVVVATHFPFLNKHGSYFLKLYQHRSYVIALQNAPLVGGMYVDEQRTGLSFRDYGDYLLLGGGGHRTGKPGGNWEELRFFIKLHYPGAKEQYDWAAQDCMSLDDIPYIGRYGKNTHGLYVATGFNKWGMTGSMVSAKLLSDMVCGKENEYAPLFDPSRSILQPQLAINGLEATVNLLTPTVKRCPHLGCALKWNKAEHSWDCPCHGSRFSPEGKVLDNPANGDSKPLGEKKT